MLAGLLALQHADSAFPSGSFAFSNGIEGLAAVDPNFGADGLIRAVSAILHHRWAGSERVALTLAHRAAGDLAQLAEIDHAIEAATLAETMRQGSRRNGASLLVTHVRLGTPGAAELRSALTAGTVLGHLPVVQGVLWRGLGLDEVAAAQMSGYQTVAGLVTAAIRLGGVGAIEAQRIVGAVLPVLAETLAEPVESPTRPDAIRLESFTPLVEIAAARHARADLRLFAN
ncbi:urease accessory protein UreF [Methylobacterium gnaphalii]|uniref:Urease accessory protein UreF n=1 Tax=Methylobacterium gnaphalii TaxID=1010610 RepID=A0A512JQ19_9HYPH|nr:urease accessory UreF family protein [Methylobacterium gnaphalii]GEP12056.1 urease accessory protein UreF 1 [Methylobacterium gnaphalii]GJD70705.1 Urease accessory protein UreF [Methylobacterium gnaphalii]GLS48647.1 urease accessory protein UreF 1 [Methylobacterium gnaphalii]